MSLSYSELAIAVEKDGLLYAITSAVDIEELKDPRLVRLAQIYELAHDELNNYIEEKAKEEEK